MKPVVHFDDFQADVFFTQPKLPSHSSSRMVCRIDQAWELSGNIPHRHSCVFEQQYQQLGGMVVTCVHSSLTDF